MTEQNETINFWNLLNHKFDDLYETKHFLIHSSIDKTELNKEYNIKIKPKNIDELNIDVTIGYNTNPDFSNKILFALTDDYNVASIDYYIFTDYNSYKQVVENYFNDTIVDFQVNLDILNELKELLL